MSTDPRPRYSIIFDGELVKGVSRETALYRLAHLTNLSESELLDRLFSVKPVIAAEADNYHLADSYREQFRQAGLKVETHVYDPEHDGIVTADLHFGHYAPLETQEIKPNFVIDTPAVVSRLKNSDIHHEGAKYQIIFNGELTENHSRKQTIDNLCHLTNSTHDEVEDNVFSAIPVIICQVDDRELAEQYQQAFQQAGLVLEQIESIEQALLFESAPRCNLLIREDKPAPMRKKRMRTFTYSLYGLAVLATVAWIAIYIAIDNYLKNQTDKPIEIDLVYQTIITKPPVTEVVEPPIPEPVAQEITPKSEEPKPAVKKQATPKQEPVKEQPPEPVKETPPEPEPPKPEKEPQEVVKQDPVPQQLRDEYNLQLLTWFAMFQQDNPLQSKYVEGEITLLVTVDRAGKLKKLKVLKSTSEELQRIVVMQFRKAKQIPGVPEKIPGDEYSFELPLRYRFN